MEKLFFLILLGCLAFAGTSVVHKVLKTPCQNQLRHAEAQEAIALTRASCETFQDTVYNEDVRIHVSVPSGSTVVLPCFYCGAFGRQKKLWYKSNFTWDNPWNIRKLLNISRPRKHFVKEVSLDPAGSDRLYIRQDNSLIINEFNLQSDYGMYLCYHNYSYDYQKGRVVYILYPSFIGQPFKVDADLLSKHQKEIVTKSKQIFSSKECSSPKDESRDNDDKEVCNMPFLNNAYLSLEASHNSECRCVGDIPQMTITYEVFLKMRQYKNPSDFYPPFTYSSSGVPASSYFVLKMNISDHMKKKIMVNGLESYVLHVPCTDSLPCPDLDADQRADQDHSSCELIDHGLDRSSDLLESMAMENILKHSWGWSKVQNKKDGTDWFVSLESVLGLFLVYAWLRWRNLV